jgi:hypothetical protein
MNDLVSIPLNKTKLLMAFAACSAAAWFGWWLLHLDDAHIATLPAINDPKFARPFGLFTLVLPGSFALWLLRRLFDVSPGLQFVTDGFIDNTNMFSMGYIAWEDVTGIEVRQIQNQKLIYVLLQDPEKYISKCNALKRALLRFCMNIGPSPVTLVTTSLELGFYEVLNLTKKNLLAHNTPAIPTLVRAQV